MEKVSVIMPAYNAEITIGDAIRSVESQTYKNFELIVVDDGSRDETAIIVDNMSMEDERIRVFHIENGGVSNARNVGLKCCTGKYVAFIDADDQMGPNMLQTMLDAMQEDVDLVCTGFMVVSPSGKDLFAQKPFNKRLDKKHYDEAIAELQDKKALNSLWNKLFRTELIKENRLVMDSAVKMGEDFLFVIDYLTCMSEKLRCLPDTVYRYTLSPKGAQATIKNGDAVQERINQLYRLATLYDREKYSLDSIYAEQLRCIYTSLIEAENIRSVLDMVYEDECNEKMLHTYRPKSKKFKLFASLLRSRNKVLISSAVSGFKSFKILKGTSYRWN